MCTWGSTSVVDYLGWNVLYFFEYWESTLIFQFYRYSGEITLRERKIYLCCLPLPDSVDINCVNNVVIPHVRIVSDVRPVIIKTGQISLRWRWAHEILFEFINYVCFETSKDFLFYFVIYLHVLLRTCGWWLTCMARCSNLALSWIAVDVTSWPLMLTLKNSTSNAKISKHIGC